MCRHMLFALVLVPVAACATGLGDEGLKKLPLPAYGDRQAAALWKGELENAESGARVDPYGLAVPRNVPIWRPPPLTPGSIAAVFEPGRSLAPIAVQLVVPSEVPLNVFVFLERCSPADLSAPACWSRWEETPWLRGIDDGAPLAFGGGSRVGRDAMAYVGRR